MKKLILVLFLFLFCTKMVFCVLSGAGTSVSPYSGTIDAPGLTWSAGEFSGNIVYVTQITIASNATLTIGSGVTVSTRTSSGYMTISSSATLVIQSGAAFTARTINNSGTLRLNSDENGNASLIILTAYNNSGGTTITENYLSGSNWHYVSTPVNGISTDIYTSSPTTLDLAQYVESLVTSNDNSTGWVGYDGYVYNPVGQNNSYIFSTLALGKGYNYYCSETTTRLISGNINYNDVPVTLTYGGTYPNSQGFNLIGNPFSSCLDWDFIFYNELPIEVQDAIYFTFNGSWATYVGGVGTNGGTNMIPPMQGFFVKTETNGIGFNLLADARAHDISQLTYKKGNSSASIPLVRIKFESQKDSDDIVVRFDIKATTAVDKKFDAYKFSKTAGKLSTWTKTNNVDYSINGLPFPEKSVDIPVGINTTAAGTYKLYSNELKNLDSYNVTLKDLSTNTTVDLKNGGAITFYTNAGMDENRFILTVENITTGKSEIPVSDKKFTVYAASGLINILSLTDELNNKQGSINIYDLTGRKILQQDNIEWNKGELKQIPFNHVDGLYIVEIRSGYERFVDKVKFSR